MCVGIVNCSKKNCLEQERCVFPVRLSLTFKIEGPEVVGKIQLSKFACRKHRKLCVNESACEILGQCMYEHPAVIASKTFKRELNKAISIDEISNVFARRLAKVKKINKK